MSELVWLNGNIQPLSQARVSVEDRGFLFADGVYEVIRLYDGHPFALDEHLERLEKSAQGILTRVPLDHGTLKREVARLLERSNVGEGMIYLQLTRGVAARNHLFPKSGDPTLLFFARALPAPAVPEKTAGTRLISLPEERWKRCWIKSIALLPNVLAKNQAVAAGADEAVFVEDGSFTECASSNFYAIIRGELVTHPVGPRVLPGITRDVLLDCAREMGIPVQERPPAQDEVRRADELFISSTIREVVWVSHLDGHVVGNGERGEVTLRLHRALRERIHKEIEEKRPPARGHIRGS